MNRSPSRAKSYRFWRRIAIIAFCLDSMVLVAEFCLFVSVVRQIPPPAEVHTDAIVVFTGGQGRISAGFALLGNGAAHKLLISGVNPAVEGAELARIGRQAGESMDCCVTLGHEATDTRGNAHETATWMQAQGFHSLRLVTSDYHAPRAIYDLKQALPDAEIVVDPVHPSLRSPRLWMQMAVEFLKYAFTLVDATIHGCFA